MEKGNVLVLGESGVGKSTLINAVLGEDCAPTGYGTSGTTKELQIYENDEVPFRVIDSIGFVPSGIKCRNAINAVVKWSKENAKKENKENAINVIWFCVEGTRSKLFPETIKNLSKAVSIWKSVPVIVVITKSYSIPDREINIELVHNAFAKQKKNSINLKKTIPVVAQMYILNDTAYAPPEGIVELIDATNDLLPEGKKAAEVDINKYNLNRKRVMAQSTVAAATTAGAVVGAIPLPFTDAAILTPTEATEIKAIAKIYGVDKKSEMNDIVNKLIEAGTVGIIAKQALSAIKAIPGIHIATSIINAVVAGMIVATIGEVSIQVYEKIYLGQEDAIKLEWIEKIAADVFDKIPVDKLTKSIKEGVSKSDLLKLVTDGVLKK